MNRARIPREAKILVEVGTSRPKETLYDAQLPFSICWVITDGTHRWKYLWIIRRKSGVYVAHTLPGGFHESYHADGTHHWKKEDGTTIPLSKGLPLDQLKAYVTLGTSSADIRSQTLVSMGLSEFADEAVDKLIYLDSRTFGPHAHTQIHLVEPFRHGEVPLHVDRPCHYFLVNHTIPWILVTISGDPNRTAT